ncbi:hypothetical protein BJX99DRAFT_219917, partial [Aspergillus californicus]
FLRGAIFRRTITALGSRSRVLVAVRFWVDATSFFLSYFFFSLGEGSLTSLVGDHIQMI